MAIAKNDPSLTQEALKKLLHYCQKTGVFTWLINSANNVKQGHRAGCINKDGYRQIVISGKTFKEHRLAFLYMTGRWPENGLDHINGCRGDNTWENLREASTKENAKNMRVYVTSKSGITGVRWKQRESRWIAQIWVDGKSIHLGSFISLNNAIVERKAAERRYGFHANHGRRYDRVNNFN